MLIQLIPLAFPALLAAAAISDIASMTIPNRLVLVLVAAFFVWVLLAGMPLGEIGLHGITGLGALAIGIGCFAAGWMGGGDAKLIAAVALWLGPSLELARFTLLSAVLGGVLTVLILLGRAFVQPITGQPSIDRLLQRDNGVPYGVALAAAGIWVFAASPMAQPLFSMLWSD